MLFSRMVRTVDLSNYDGVDCDGTNYKRGPAELKRELVSRYGVPPTYMLGNASSRALICM